MKTFLNLTAYILILLELYSCNGDVFVDDFRSSDSELTLDGNGDVAILHFASSNWELLNIYTYSESFSYQYKVYDENDNLITEEPIPYLKGLGKIVCDEELTDFVIERSNPKELKIAVGENVRSTHFQFIIRVGNEYESQEIYVDISPSDRYVLDRITYSLDAYSYEQKKEVQNSFPQSNGWGIPYPCPVFPYENAYHKVTFESYEPGAFQLLGEDNLTVEIPVVEDNYLVMSGKQAQYTSNQQSLPFPNTEKIEVPIPPYSIQRITLWLTYEWFETDYTLYAFHPQTKKQRIITGKLQSKMPGKYCITQEDIK